METPLGVAGARARNSVGSSDWQALCDLEAELEAELRDEVTRSSERSRRKRAEGDGHLLGFPGGVLGTADTREGIHGEAGLVALEPDGVVLARLPFASPAAPLVGALGVADPRARPPRAPTEARDARAGR